MENKGMHTFNAEEILHEITDAVVCEPKDGFGMRRDELIAMWNRVVADTENGVIVITDDELDLLRW